MSKHETLRNFNQLKIPFFDGLVFCIVFRNKTSIQYYVKLTVRTLFFLSSYHTNVECFNFWLSFGRLYFAIRRYSVMMENSLKKETLTFSFCGFSSHWIFIEQKKKKKRNLHVILAVCIGG